MIRAAVLTPIRPTALPPTYATPQGASGDSARAVAQKAFFDAAMGRVPAPTVTRTQAVIQGAAPVPQRAELRPTADAQAPARVLRPGSLLDIRV